MLDALAERGKRWNAEKLCVEDMPKRKFKKGDKVRIKHGVSSKTHYNIYPWFVDEMDDLIGKTMTVDRYTDVDGYVECEETESIFREEWLEPYVEDIPKRKFKKGDRVRIKDGISSKTHRSVAPNFVVEMDDLIGKTMTVYKYTDDGKTMTVYTYIDDGKYVACKETEYIFHEDWLEPMKN